MSQYINMKFVHLSVWMMWNMSVYLHLLVRRSLAGQTKWLCFKHLVSDLNYACCLFHTSVWEMHHYFILNNYCKKTAFKYNTVSLTFNNNRDHFCIIICRQNSQWVNFRQEQTWWIQKWWVKLYFKVAASTELQFFWIACLLFSFSE